MISENYQNPVEAQRKFGRGAFYQKLTTFKYTKIIAGFKPIVNIENHTIFQFLANFLWYTYRFLSKYISYVFLSLVGSIFW